MRFRLFEATRSKILNLIVKDIIDNLDENKFNRLNTVFLIKDDFEEFVTKFKHFNMKNSDVMYEFIESYELKIPEKELEERLFPILYDEELDV